MQKILTQYKWTITGLAKPGITTTASTHDGFVYTKLKENAHNPKGLGSKKRGKDGRFQQHIYTMKFNGSRLSLLIGILLAEVVVFLILLNR